MVTYVKVYFIDDEKKKKKIVPDDDARDDRGFDSLREEMIRELNRLKEIMERQERDESERDD